MESMCIVYCIVYVCVWNVLKSEIDGLHPFSRIYL